MKRRGADSSIRKMYEKTKWVRYLCLTGLIPPLKIIYCILIHIYNYYWEDLV